MNRTQAVADLQAALGYQPLTRAWAKAEIFLGLAAAWGGLVAGVIAAKGDGLDVLTAAAGLASFVLGGYLALAGSRSHLYQSSTELAAYLVGVIRDEAAARRKPS